MQLDRWKKEIDWHTHWEWERERERDGKKDDGDIHQQKKINAIAAYVESIAVHLTVTKVLAIKSTRPSILAIDQLVLDHLQQQPTDQQQQQQQQQQQKNPFNRDYYFVKPLCPFPFSLASFLLSDDIFVEPKCSFNSSRARSLMPSS